MKKKDDSVNLEDLHGGMWGMLWGLDELWREEVGYELIITSGCDGRHSNRSRHYIGCAVDIRTWDAPLSGSQVRGEKRTALHRLVQKTAGNGFLVLDEPKHFHIQMEKT